MNKAFDDLNLALHDLFMEIAKALHLELICNKLETLLSKFQR